MTSIEFGRERDRRIIEAVAKFRALTREQIQQLCGFHGTRAAAMCRRRLKRLHDRRALRRYQPDRNSSYIYHAGERRGQVEHHLVVADVYLAMLACRRPGQTLTFDLEPDVGCHLRPDALAVMRPGFAAFVEVDRGTNRFDKWERYTALFRSGCNVDGTFPAVLVVTPRKLAGPNPDGLRFIVCSREEVMEACRSLNR
ncbi:MAG: replication-relaxation family protein [Pseudomonadota bacterium]